MLPFARSLSDLAPAFLRLCDWVFKLGKVSLDGTKIKANASKHKAMSWAYANKLEAQLRREVHLAAIKKAKAEIERRAKERFEAEQGEWNLVCTAWNLKRMYALGD